MGHRVDRRDYRSEPDPVLDDFVQRILSKPRVKSEPLIHDLQWGRMNLDFKSEPVAQDRLKPNFQAESVIERTLVEPKKLITDVHPPWSEPIPRKPGAEWRNLGGFLMVGGLGLILASTVLGFQTFPTVLPQLLGVVLAALVAGSPSALWLGILFIKRASNSEDAERRAGIRFALALCCLSAGLTLAGAIVMTGAQSLSPSWTVFFGMLMLGGPPLFVVGWRSYARGDREADEQSLLQDQDSPFQGAELVEFRGFRSSRRYVGIDGVMNLIEITNQFFIRIEGSVGQLNSAPNQLIHNIGCNLGGIFSGTPPKDR